MPPFLFSSNIVLQKLVKILVKILKTGCPNSFLLLCFGHFGTRVRFPSRAFTILKPMDALRQPWVLSLIVIFPI